MIPTNWQPHLRADGHHPGELVGYLVPADDPSAPGVAAGVHRIMMPVNLFGHPLGEATDTDSATDILDAEGLASLADRWELTVDGEARRVVVVEVDAQRVVLADDNFGAIGPPGSVPRRFVLDIPVSADILRRC